MLIASEWITEVNESEAKIHIGLTREEVKDSPEFNATEPVNREYEAHLYDYYGRPKYWE